ncbi:hypothetical protein [Methanocrinis sp.]|uniref:hypothetical protein n=1 Tax=Methanocrinis sp. TaxID=3101522 RepID=UPI003D0ECBB0
MKTAPDLPPRGLNTESSRTRVDIYNQDDVRIYGFCALASSENLQDLWFSVEKGEGLSESAYIVMTDRRCDLSYISNEVYDQLRFELGDSYDASSNPDHPRKHPADRLLLEGEADLSTS